jgi:hypothetical protein
VQSEQDHTPLNEASLNPRPGDFKEMLYSQITSTQNCWSLEVLNQESVKRAQCDITPETYRDILVESLALLNASPTAKMMIREASSQGWSLGIADRMGHDFHLDVPQKQILLDDCGFSPAALGRSGYFRHVVLISLIRALRDAWQEKRHGGFDTDYGPEAILMLERVRAADCDVMSVLVAWELRGEGFSAIWRHLLGSEEGDMALAFSNYLERDPASLFTGKALEAAFNQWYRSDVRVNASDHEALEYMDSVIADNQGGSPFGSKKLTSVGVEVLSCLPDKTAYLRGRGRDLLSSPLYAGLHDHINQSHFMQLVHDLQVTYVQGIPFRDAGLARKIFPGGVFTTTNPNV